MERGWQGCKGKIEGDGEFCSPGLHTQKNGRAEKPCTAAPI
ncbi:hypothetical protein [Paenibacillus sp. BK720]|nr:hypothetical protein [Paenibacillus sp. BK720]NIK71325.1 hypothetical protein [Paenibacillus sp. BK720]